MQNIDPLEIANILATELWCQQVYRLQKTSRASIFKCPKNRSNLYYQVSKKPAFSGVESVFPDDILGTYLLMF